MKVQKYLVVACVLSVFSPSVQAVTPTDINEAIEQVQRDSELISGWLSREIKHGIPFNSTSGNIVPTQFKMLGFGFGISAIASRTKPDNGALHNLGTDVIDTQQIDTLDEFPIPMILAHAKVGLPWGMDAGVRIGGIPSTDSDDGDTHYEVSNTVFGLDLRKALIEEGISRPFGLTLGVNYTHAKGHITVSTPYEASTGSDVTFTDAFGSSRSEWNTDSIGFQAIVNKKILFLNPYLGASVNQNFGDVKTSITNAGTITYVPTSTTQAFSTVGTASENVETVDVRGLLGLEFTLFPFLKLGIHGEVADDNRTAASLGLRFQFR